MAAEALQPCQQLRMPDGPEPGAGHPVEFREGTQDQHILALDGQANDAGGVGKWIYASSTSTTLRSGLRSIALTIRSCGVRVPVGLFGLQI